MTKVKRLIKSKDFIFEVILDILTILSPENNFHSLRNVEFIYFPLLTLSQLHFTQCFWEFLKLENQFRCTMFSFKCRVEPASNVYLISPLNYLSNWKFGENYFFIIYFWGVHREVLGTAPIPMCVGTVPQVLFPPYFPTKILLEHAPVFLRGRGRAGEKGRGKLWGRPIQTPISGYTGHALKAVHRLFSRSHFIPIKTKNILKWISNPGMCMATRLLAKHS